MKETSKDWAKFIDPECLSGQDKELTIVSGFVAGQAYNELCRMLGGRFPDLKLAKEAPTAHKLFMTLFGHPPL